MTVTMAASGRFNLAVPVQRRRRAPVLGMACGKRRLGRGRWKPALAHHGLQQSIPTRTHTVIRARQHPRTNRSPLQAWRWPCCHAKQRRGARAQRWPPWSARQQTAGTPAAPWPPPPAAAGEGGRFCGNGRMPVRARAHFQVGMRGTAHHRPAPTTCAPVPPPSCWPPRAAWS